MICFSIVGYGMLIERLITKTGGRMMGAYKLKFQPLLVRAVMAFALLIGQEVLAAPAWGPGVNTIFFKNFESQYRHSGNCTPTTCLPFAAANDPAGWQKVDPSMKNNILPGDVFAGIFEVQNINNQGAPIWDFDAGTDEFTGYFAQRVVAVLDPDPIPGGGAFACSCGTR